jgi:hypothetical protein
MVIGGQRTRSETGFGDQTCGLPDYWPDRPKGLEPEAPFAYQAPMEEPSPRSSRLALAGALLATIVVGGAGFLLGRIATEQKPAAISQPVATPPTKRVPEAASSAILGRADLIALAATAADALAAGRDPGPEITEAAGRRFELRLPFGCNGPAGDESAVGMRWRYDTEAQALRIHVRPVAWTAQDWWPQDADNQVEAIEGFWIERPWTSSEACPDGGDRPAAAGTEPVTLPGQTLAVGQIFYAEGARSGRRDGEPYEAVVRIAEEELAAADGLRFRIRGRIARAGGVGPVRCRQPAGAEQRPICLVSVVIDDVAVENAAGDRTLATWSLGGRDIPEA